MNKHQTNTVIRQYQQLYLRSTFREWRKQFNNNKSLIKSLHNFENLMRNRIVDESFKNLKSYSNSKALVKNDNGLMGANNTKRIIHNLYLKALNRAFQKYKA